MYKRKSFQVIGPILTASNTERMLLMLQNFIPHICVFKVHFALFLHTVFGDTTTASTLIELVLLFTENTVWKDITCLIFWGKLWARFLTTAKRKGRPMGLVTLPWMIAPSPREGWTSWLCVLWLFNWYKPVASSIEMVYLNQEADQWWSEWQRRGK